MSDYKGCESPICDFCKHYKDAGTGNPKRSGFAGIGLCGIDDTETTADAGCEDHFVCRICQREILELWSCV